MNLGWEDVLAANGIEKCPGKGVCRAYGSVHIHQGFAKSGSASKAVRGSEREALIAACDAMEDAKANGDVKLFGLARTAVQEAMGRYLSSISEGIDPVTQRVMHAEEGQRVKSEWEALARGKKMKQEMETVRWAEPDSQMLTDLRIADIRRRKKGMD